MFAYLHHKEAGRRTTAKASVTNLHGIQVEVVGRFIQKLRKCKGTHFFREDAKLYELEGTKKAASRTIKGA